MTLESGGLDSIKFMQYRDQFDRETQLRTSIKLSTDFVVPLTSSHDGGRGEGRPWGGVANAFVARSQPMAGGIPSQV